MHRVIADMLAAANLLPGSDLAAARRTRLPS